MRALSLSDENRQQITSLVDFASRPENLYRPGMGPVPGDVPGYVRHIDSYRVVFTLTEVDRHLSVSIPAPPGRLPHPYALFTIATWCGFTGGQIVEGVTVEPGADWVVGPNECERCAVAVQCLARKATA